MNVEKLTTIKSLQNFLEGNQSIVYSVLGNKAEHYQFTRNTLIKFSYMTCTRSEKGIIKRYLMKLTGYSRS